MDATYFVRLPIKYSLQVLLVDLSMMFTPPAPLAPTQNLTLRFDPSAHVLVLIRVPSTRHIARISVVQVRNNRIILFATLMREKDPATLESLLLLAADFFETETD